MAQYRKRSMIVEAIKADIAIHNAGSHWNELPTWLVNAYEKGGIIFTQNGVYVPTLSGTVLVEPDDWIIRGVKGELYPCKSDIFEATYEFVDDHVPYSRILSDIDAKIFGKEGSGAEVYQALNHQHQKYGPSPKCTVKVTIIFSDDTSYQLRCPALKDRNDSWYYDGPDIFNMAKDFVDRIVDKQESQTILNCLHNSESTDEVCSKCNMPLSKYRPSPRSLDDRFED